MAEKAEKKHPQYRGKNAETAYAPKVRKAISVKSIPVKPIAVKKAEVEAKAPAPVAPDAPKVSKKSSVKGSKK